MADTKPASRKGAHAGTSLLILVMWGLWQVCLPALAHPGFPASALVQVSRSGEVTVHIRHDALAFALNESPVTIGDEPMLNLLSGPRDELHGALDAARERMQSLFGMAADGRLIESRVIAMPTVEAIETARDAASPPRLPFMLDCVIEAQLPPSASTFSIAFPEVLGDVIMTVERPGHEPFSLPLRNGEQTPEFEVALGGDFDVPTEARSPPVSALNVFLRYIWFGITHIIPHGLDHVLFVLGLFFLSPKLRPLLWQVTAFTLAHSVTLTLATMDLVRLAPEIIEPIIAASIAFVAIENVVTTKIHPWRPIIVFVFGLIHGMGFAGVLRDVGLPPNQLAPALVSFNIGVELGQLAVIALAFALVGWWRKKKWYRPWIAIPASLGIAAAGTWWTIERLMNW